MNSFNNLAGRTFGRLTVLDEHERRPCGRETRPFWKCQCECGAVRWIRSTKLSEIESCGCLGREHSSITHRTHGMSKTPEFAAWQQLNKRCYVEDDQSFKHYGGRGIKVCDRWRESFANFFADMGPRPGKEYSIDRYPDNDGNYEPGNCRWTTDAQQCRNTRTTRLSAFLVGYARWQHSLGRSVIELSRSLKINRGTLYDAIMGRTWRGI
jgi:hypothetical protein